MREIAVALKQRVDIALSVNHVGQSVGVAMLYK